MKQIAQWVADFVRQPKHIAFAILSVLLVTCIIVTAGLISRHTSADWWVAALVVVVFAVVILLGVRHRRKIVSYLRQARVPSRLQREALVAAMVKHAGEPEVQPNHTTMPPVIPPRQHQPNLSAEESQLEELTQEIRLQGATSDAHVVELLTQIRDGLFERKTRKTELTIDPRFTPKVGSLPRWVRTTIGKNDEVLVYIKKHWLEVVFYVTPMTILTGLLLLALSMFREAQVQLLIVCAGIWALAMTPLVIALLRHHRYSFVIARSGIHQYRGILTIESDLVPVQMITGLTTKQPWYGRPFGFWSAKVETADQKQAIEWVHLLSGRGPRVEYIKQLIADMVQD